jgi:hypothetical protein
MPTITNEIWIAMALLAKGANNIHHSVRNNELQAKVKDLFDDTRSGVYTHISQHVVAQKKLNTGYNKCYLTEIGKGVRRLFLPYDEIHETRLNNPQTLPVHSDIPTEYQHLLGWYKKQAPTERKISQLNDKVFETKPPISVKRKLPKDRIRLSGFFSNFDNAYQNFYKSDATYKNFQEGPCIHFHRKAISMWEGHIKNSDSKYRYILEDDEYPEAIYATLTAWGMNRLGGGPKLKDYPDFKENLLSIVDYLEEIRNYNIIGIDQIKNSIEDIFTKLDPSENERNLIAKSKTLHHLNPEIFPPIDKRYTLELLTKIKDLNPAPSMNSVSFKNFWNILMCFKLIITHLGFESLRNCIGKEIMDTSVTKIIDNAIIGFSDLTLDEI